MNTHGDLIKSDFHDTTLDGIVRHDFLVVLTIGYYDEDDIEQTVEVSIGFVGHIPRDDIPTCSFGMGEVMDQSLPNTPGFIG